MTAPKNDSINEASHVTNHAGKVPLHQRIKLPHLLLSISGMMVFSAQADVSTAERLANNFALVAKSELSAEEGKAFYTKRQSIKGKELACASCHADNPLNLGKHSETGKVIQPMAPSANPKRFADLEKSGKHFSKHCNDLYGQDCSPKDKGNFIAYLLTFEKP